MIKPFIEQSYPEQEVRFFSGALGFDESAMIEQFAQRHDGFDRLLKRLDRMYGQFVLYFARCNVPEYRKRLAAALMLEFDRPIVQINMYDLQFDRLDVEIDKVLRRELQDAPEGAPLFLYGLEKLFPVDDPQMQYQVFFQLSLRRDFYDFGRPLVIWLSDAGLRQLAEGAPDFYDWYSNVYEFDVPADQRAGLMQRSLAEVKDNRQVHPAYRLSRE